MARTVGPLDIVSPEVMERIEINRTGARSKGNSNGVKTARYTMWNFIPQNLFEQLSQMSNLYFFVVGLMQMIPAVCFHFLISSFRALRPKQYCVPNGTVSQTILRLT